MEEDDDPIVINLNVDALFMLNYMELHKEDRFEIGHRLKTLIHLFCLQI